MPTRIFIGVKAWALPPVLAGIINAVTLRPKRPKWQFTDRIGFILRPLCAAHEAELPPYKAEINTRAVPPFIRPRSSNRQARTYATPSRLGIIPDLAGEMDAK